MAFSLFKNGSLADFLLDADCSPGILRVAGYVRRDLEAVTGVQAAIVQEAGLCRTAEVVIAGLADESDLLLRLAARGKISLDPLVGKCEVFMSCLVQDPFEEFPAIKNALVIAGSDLRGCIYGLFNLAERCGVSPLVYFGDVTSARKRTVELDFPVPFVSREASVRYRGFFINDEWPAFGSWCQEKFGGVNARAYETVFEFLLRLKGNYLWPAMWRSSFWQDGPDLASAALADELGIVMGTSHHEPLCRAGAEWQNQYRRYGDDPSWNFSKNGAAITRFWKEGLERGGHLGNVITLGMRGEHDSRLLSDEATLADNIAELKKAILVQHALIRETVNADLAQVPRMLAVYKEVEDYFFGDGSCEGLRNWEELEEVIFLLADDNFGHLRALPPGPHQGGYGMYYHFDYHGGPVSYEWLSTIRLAKTWEQMCLAWESGIREMWIVNVGDIKGLEYPLNYFMDLAWDFDTWGSSNPDSPQRWAQTWVETQFGDSLSREQKEDVLEVLSGYCRLNALRRPETQSPTTFHPFNHDEAGRVWAEADRLMKKAAALKDQMPAEALLPYCSMIHYPAAASLNILLMNLEAGLNQALAARGCLVANSWRASLAARIQADSDLVAACHGLAGGKWNHLMDSAHTGFRSWDDHDWTYPVISQVIPIPRAKIMVSFRGSDRFCLGEHWQGTPPLSSEDFLRPDAQELILDIDSRGSIGFGFQVECDRTWLGFSALSGRFDPAVTSRVSLVLRADRSDLRDVDTARVTLSFHFDNHEKTTVRLEIPACPAVPGYRANHHVESRGCISMEAARFGEKTDLGSDGWKVIPDLGRHGPALVSFPLGKKRDLHGPLPRVKYSFITEAAGDYTLEFRLAPRNPGVRGVPDILAWSVNSQPVEHLETVARDYFTEWQNPDWNSGVMNSLRIVKVLAKVEKGTNQLFLYATGPGIIVEKIVLYPRGSKIPDSYLGPPESWFAK